jgi:putative SOS response-associated peptidase YedK
MCNLYSITTNQAAIIALFRVMNRYIGNLPPMPGVFPDYPAPVIRNVGSERELTMMRWGMPPPPRTGGPPVTNIRNTSSPHWRGWLKPENRCLVPFNSFAEYAPEPNPETKKKDVVWFALDDNRRLTAFAGIWTEFKGDRGTKSKPIPGPHLVYGFLTTSPNAVVEPIHPKAMPVILTTDEERCVDILTRHNPLHVFQNGRYEAAVILELLGTVQNPYSCLLAQELIIGGLIGILKAPPATNVVNEYECEVGLTVPHILNQPLQFFPTIYPNAAATVVGIGADDGNIAMRRIGSDRGGLIFDGILLVIGGHAHILRGPEALGGVMVPRTLFASHRTVSQIDRPSSWLGFVFLILRIPSN